MEKRIALLFDFDGVIMDTEHLYTGFWKKLGEKYFGRPEFGYEIKGQTLKQIFDIYFPGDEKAVREITAAIDAFEKDMEYKYVPGADIFLKTLKDKSIPTAIVTSSNRQKMQSVYRQCPEIPHLVDKVLTGEDFTRSKPAPDCFLLGMELLGSTPDTTFIFEDSFSGLKAARDSGGMVIGLATTNPYEKIAPLADKVISDFIGTDIESLCSEFGIM